MKLLTDSIKFSMDYKGKKVNVEVAILPGSASFKFDNPKLAKEAYNFEKSHGSTRVKFVEKENVLIEFYPRKNRLQVRNLVIHKLKQAGAKQLDKKSFKELKGG